MSWRHGAGRGVVPIEGQGAGSATIVTSRATGVVRRSRRGGSKMSDSEDVIRPTRRLHIDAREALQPLGWRPAADIYRVAEGWLLKLELAGVTAEEIEIVAQSRLLLVRGRRRDTELVKGCECHSMEIVYSQFERVFELPVDVGGARLVSDLRNGMLLVRIITEATRR